MIAIVSLITLLIVLHHLVIRIFVIEVVVVKSCWFIRDSFISNGVTTKNLHVHVHVRTHCLPYPVAHRAASN